MDREPAGRGARWPFVLAFVGLLTLIAGLAAAAAFAFVRIAELESDTDTMRAGIRALREQPTPDFAAQFEERFTELEDGLAWEDCTSFADYEDLRAYQEYLAGNASFSRYRNTSDDALDLAAACDDAYRPEGFERYSSIEDYYDFLDAR